MAEWQQQRPPWCPHPDCAYKISSQAVLCIGELPRPEPHDGDHNTHRLCQRGAPDDGEWLHSFQLNRGDAWAYRRLLDSVFGFNR